MFWTEEQTTLEEEDDDDGLLEGVGVGEVGKHCIIDNKSYCNLFTIISDLNIEFDGL